MARSMRGVTAAGASLVRTTSYIVRQEVWKPADNTKVAEANIVFVAVGQDGRSVRVPEEWRQMLPHWPEAAY